MPAEIQIRTNAMNFWATAEHSLRYKYSGNIPQDLQDRLKNCAEAAFHLDQEMATIREEITNAQRLNEIKNNLVANILENIQNLYFVAKLDDMNEINKEFIRLWNGDDMEALKEFNEKLRSWQKCIGYRKEFVWDYLPLGICISALPSASPWIFSEKTGKITVKKS